MPLSVLFVDDEDDLREIVVDALAAQGFAVTTARNGLEAIACLRSEAQFSIVVTDYSMPEGVSGLDVASEAAAMQPNARILLASGYSRSQLPALPENVHFLSKPYRFKQLIAAIHDQLS
ncbi:Response regulator receiver domain-containing protein [Stenotrophomonas maltophilia]|nr:Response regulator receiver domain-containing protein [Stenotrophomonas maltophilia]